MAASSLKSGPENITTAKGTQHISKDECCIFANAIEADKKVMELRKALGDMVTVRRFGASPFSVNVYR